MPSSVLTSRARGPRPGAPALRPEARPSPPEPRRRPGLVIAGAAFAAIGGLGGLWLVTSAQHRTGVLVVSRDITVGARITATDLGEVDVAVPPGVVTVPVSRRDTLVGKVARTDLAAGTLLAPGAIGDPTPPDRGQSVIVLALPPSRIPASGLHPGQHLVLVSTVEPGTAGGDPSADRPPPATATADADVVRVGSVDPGGDTGGTTAVDVAVHTVDGPLWAGLAASGRVTVLIEPYGPAPR